MIQCKRAYEAPAPQDGERVLVDRMWPRNRRKDQLALSAWLPEVAPSAALRQAFHAHTLGFDEFARCYREELAAWDEMQRLEIGLSCWWLVFHGHDGKRLWMRKPFSSFASWFKDEDDADYEDPILASLLEMATHHGVPMEGGILTPFKTSRA